MQYKQLIEKLNGFAIDWRQSETEVDKIRADGLAYDFIDGVEIERALISRVELICYYDVAKRLKGRLT